MLEPEDTDARKLCETRDAQHAQVKAAIRRPFIVLAETAHIPAQEAAAAFGKLKSERTAATPARLEAVPSAGPGDTLRKLVGDDLHQRNSLMKAELAKRDASLERLRKRIESLESQVFGSAAS